MFLGTTFPPPQQRGNKYLDLKVVIAEPEYPISGSLLLTQDAIISANPVQFTVADNGNGEHFLAGVTTCKLDVTSTGNGQHVYGVIDFTVLLAGSYTFRGMYSTPSGYYVPAGTAHRAPWHPLGDPFLAVYQNFNANQPDTGIISCNDDSNDVVNLSPAVYTSNNTIIDGHQPFLTATLQPGHYSVVLLTYKDVSASQWAAGIWGSQSWTAGVGSTNFQLWGPNGGLTAGHVPLLDTTLADTGTQQEILGLLALAVLFGGAVTLGLTRRRA